MQRVELHEALCVEPHGRCGLAPYNLGIGALSEGLLTLWFLVIGVNVSKRQEKANRVGVA